MQSNRDFYTLKRPKLVLTKSFRVVNDLEIGQSGQLKVSGVIQQERLDEMDNGTEYLIKTLLVDKVEVISSKAPRYE